MRVWLKTKTRELNMRSRRIFLEMGLAVIGLGLYLWYLHHIHYPINWTLVALLTVVCLGVSFLFMMRKP